MKKTQIEVQERDEMIISHLADVTALKESVASYESLVAEKGREFERLEQEKTSMINAKENLY